MWAVLRALCARNTAYIIVFGGDFQRTAINYRRISGSRTAGVGAPALHCDARMAKLIVPLSPLVLNAIRPLESALKLPSDAPLAATA